MSNLPALPWDAVSTHDRKIVTTSLKVAEVFGKNHQHVLRDIRAISQRKSAPSDIDNGTSTVAMMATVGDPIAEFSQSNFGQRKYTYEAGKNQQREADMIEMTKDGFMLLVMGYTGEKAMLFKIAYIAEFNRMAERLARGDYAKAAMAERAYFERYPDRRQIRDLAMVGEPYWFIGRMVNRAAGTVSNAIRHMIKWGMMDAKALVIARSGMSAWWHYRRKHFNQLAFNF